MLAMKCLEHVRHAADAESELGTALAKPLAKLYEGLVDEPEVKRAERLPGEELRLVHVEAK